MDMEQGQQNWLFCDRLLFMQSSIYIYLNQIGIYTKARNILREWLGSKEFIKKYLRTYISLSHHLKNSNVSLLK